MTIKVFICTYRAPHRINMCLASLFASGFNGSINVISNHTDHGIRPDYLAKINLINNEARPDWSTGHLSRSWNQCIMHGFKNLKAPACEALVLAQDDNLFQPDWHAKAEKLLETYDFVQQGRGDACMLMTPDAVMDVGMWDERFLFACHAADYFWRCVLHLRERATISDPNHKRVWNPSDPWALIKPESRSLAINGGGFFKPQALDMSIAGKLTLAKYGYDPCPWTPEKIASAKPVYLIKNYIMYPYFEKDVRGLEDKNYLL